MGGDAAWRNVRVSKSTTFEEIAERVRLRELVDVSVHAGERADDRV